MTPSEWTMLVLLSVLWGGSFFFNAVALADLPTLTVVLGRLALGALVLMAVMRIMGSRMPRDARVWRALFAMGFLNNVVPFTLIVWGQLHIASGLAAVLNATTPLFTVLVAHVVTADEKLGVGRVVGVLAGFSGVAVMMGGDVLVQQDGGSITLLAQCAVLGAALSYGFAAIFGRRFRTLGVAPVAVATGQVTTSSLMLLPLVLLVDQPWTLPVPGLPAIGAIAGVAVLSTALAYVLYFRILSTAGATNLSLVTFLIPVSAIALGAVILGETLAPRHFAGMALISLGLADIDGRPAKALSRITGRRP